MTLLQQLQEDLKTAMKQRDAETLQTIRGIISAVKNKQIDSSEELDDDGVQKVIATLSKQLKDALKDFETAGREDLIEKTTKEIALLESFLPKQLSDSQIEEIAKKVIDKVGTENFGLLMGAVVKEVAGQAEGNRVREILQKLIG